MGSGTQSGSSRAGSGSSRTGSRTLINMVTCAGYFYHPWSEACEPCPSGSYYTNDMSGRRCEVCPLGTAQPLIGQRECTKCEPGTFTAKTGLKTCVPCQVSGL